MRDNSFYTVILVNKDIHKISNDLRRLGATAYISNGKISVFCPDFNSANVNRVKAICCRYPTVESSA